MSPRPRKALTEGDVRRAARDGVRAIPPGERVVTPSARDAAKALGVTIGPGERQAPGPPAVVTRVAVGADHGGVALKDAIAVHVRQHGVEVNDVGTTGTEPVDYPDFAERVAHEVASGRAQIGIMVDGAGIGSCMVANKVAGVRAAMCHDITTAVNAREHNDANVLTLGGGLLGQRLALEVVDAFLRTAFGGGRHARRVAKIVALDARQ